MGRIDLKPYLSELHNYLNRGSKGNKQIVVYFKINEIGEPYLISSNRELLNNTKSLLKEYPISGLSKFVMNAPDFFKEIKNILELHYVVFTKVDKNLEKNIYLKKFSKNFLLICIPDNIWDELLSKKDIAASFEFLCSEINKKGVYRKIERIIPHEKMPREEFCKFINSLSWLSMKIKKSDIYVISSVNLSSSMNCISFYIEEKSRQVKKIQDLRKIGRNIVNKLLFPADTKILDIISIYHDDILRHHKIRNAISSIMARNMSHNIGSHVMARVSTGGIDGWTTNKRINELIDALDVGTHKRDIIEWSKDVQYLCRYIQQRMDFIAQISTEWPSWTEPAYLMNDLMHWFLSQKHLLNHIAASEGLQAHSFMNDEEPKPGNTIDKDPQQSEQKNAPTQEKEEVIDDNKGKSGDIRFHVFMVPGNCWNKQMFCTVEERKISLKPGSNNIVSQEGNKQKCIILEEKDCESCSTCRSTLLFTAAKSEAECRLDEDILLAIPGGIVGYHAFYIILENIIRNGAKHDYTRRGHDHFDVVIEILYDPDDTIGIQIQKEEKREKIPAFLLRIYNNTSILRDEKKIEVVNLVEMNKLLQTSIVTETGDLNKGNWGLAEMKIAAGFLQQRDIFIIGVGKEKVTGKKTEDFKKLGESESGIEAIIRAVKSPIGTLGYEFYIPKPRTVGIVCPWGKEVGNV